MNWLTVSGSANSRSRSFYGTRSALQRRRRIPCIQSRAALGKNVADHGVCVRDVLFRPLIREYYTTDAYIGLQRRIGTRIQFSVLADYVRSWKVQDSDFAIAQAIRPAATFEYKKSAQWSFQGAFTLSRGEGFHTYDNVQTGFLASYVKPLRGELREGGQDVPVAYPLRFSFGIQQQTFYNFSGSQQSLFSGYPTGFLLSDVYGIVDDLLEGMQIRVAGGCHEEPGSRKWSRMSAVNPDIVLEPPSVGGAPPVLRAPNSLRAAILSGSMILLVGSGLVSVINLAYNILLARVLGATGFGHAVSVYTLLMLLSAVTLSFQFVCSKFVAKNNSLAAKAAVYSVLHRRSWQVGALVGITLAVASPAISRYLNLPTPG